MAKKFAEHDGLNLHATNLTGIRAVECGGCFP